MILRRVRFGWLNRALAWLRWSRVFAYAGIAAAGLTSMIHPPLSITQATQSGQILIKVWAGLMFVSSAFCAWGAARERWVGEYVGLIPLSLVAAVFGVSAFSRGTVGWAGGFFLIGFAWLLAARWQEVALLRREAERLHRQIREQEGKDGA